MAGFDSTADNTIPRLVIIKRFNTQKLIHRNMGGITVTTGQFKESHVKSRWSGSVTMLLIMGECYSVRSVMADSRYWRRPDREKQEQSVIDAFLASKENS